MASAESSLILFTSDMANTFWSRGIKCPNCGEAYSWPSYECSLCGMLSTKCGEGNELASLGLGLISSLLEVLDNSTESPAAREMIKHLAAGVVAFQPMSLHDLYTQPKKTRSKTNTLSIDQVGVLQRWLKGYPCANDLSSQEDVCGIFLNLALAFGSLESIVTVSNYFVEVGDVPITGADLLRLAGFMLDYLHRRILDAYSHWSTTKKKAMTKWLCDRCGTLNQYSSAECDVCAGPRPGGRSTQDVSVLIGDTKRYQPPPPPRDGNVTKQENGRNTSSQHLDMSVSGHSSIGTTQEIDCSQSQCAIDFKTSPVKTFANFGQVLFSEVEKLTRIHLLMEESVTDTPPLVEPWVIDVRQESMDFLTTSICNLTDETKTNRLTDTDTLNVKLMCFLQLLKLNFRRITTVKSDKSRRKQVADVSVDILWNALALIEGSDAIENTELKAEILAVRLEAVAAEGVAAVLALMSAAPSNVPVLAGGCAAIDNALHSKEMMELKDRRDKRWLDMIKDLKGGNAGAILFGALGTFLGNMSVVRPALSILSDCLEVVESLESYWNIVVQVMTAVFHNERCLLQCLKIVNFFCNSMSLSIENDITRATVNLAINAMRNHMVEDIQETSISVLLAIVQSNEKHQRQCVSYLVDAGGVHTTMSGITILERRKESKRKGVDLLSMCLIDERCFNDIQVPVAIDCIEAYPNDTFMLLSCLKIIQMLIEKSAKRQRFMELRGIPYIVGALMISCKNSIEELGESASTIVYKYMKRSNQRERGKFGKMVSSHPTTNEVLELCDRIGNNMSATKVSNNAGLGIIPYALVKVQSTFSNNMTIAKATFSSFMLAARASADQSDIDSLFLALPPKQLVGIMNAYISNKDIQRDGCWLCNFMAESTGSDLLPNRDALVEAGGFGAIVAAMQSHPTDESIQTAGCIAIMNVSGQRGGGRGKKARKAGCEMAIKHACELLENAQQPESLAAAKLAYKRMNKKCELM